MFNFMGYFDNNKNRISAASSFKRQIKMYKYVSDSTSASSAVSPKCLSSAGEGRLTFAFYI